MGYLSGVCPDCKALTVRVELTRNFVVQSLLSPYTISTTTTIALTLGRANYLEQQMSSFTPVDLCGTWQLVATRAWDDDNNTLPTPFGPLARGIVVLEENGRMMCVLADARVELLDEAPRAYSTYMGQYTIVDDTLTTRVDGSVDSDRIGSDQVRKLRYENDRLFLRPPSRPNYGVTEHRELEWQRIG